MLIKSRDDVQNLEGRNKKRNGKVFTIDSMAIRRDFRTKEKVLNLFQMVELNKWYCLLGHIFLSVEVDNVTAGTEQW